MKKIPFGKYYKIGKAFLVKHSADILTGFTACGVVITALETRKATLKAEEYLRINGYEQANPDTQKVLKWEARKQYILPAVTGAATIGAAVGANYINHKQIAGLAAACTVAETALSEHRDKIEELLGEKTLKEVDNSLARDKMERIMASESTILDTGHGHVLCIDGITGLRVWSSPDWFYYCRNAYNADINQTLYSSIADWADYLLRDCKDIAAEYRTQEWMERGYGLHGPNATGLLEFNDPQWSGNASEDAYVIFEPTRRPMYLYAE